MRFESIPVPIKSKAKEIVLAEFSHREHVVLAETMFRDPVQPEEWRVWDRFQRRLAEECASLQHADAWSTRALLALLSAPQDRALKLARRHLGRRSGETNIVLRAAFTSLIAARHDEIVGIRNRETNGLTHWTDWEELYEDAQSATSS